MRSASLWLEISDLDSFPAIAESEWHVLRVFQQPVTSLFGTLPSHIKTNRFTLGEKTWKGRSEARGD